MIPSVAQQIQAIRHRLEETVIPELPADAKFAREQAAFIVMTLDWLLDTQEHEYRYEVVENDQYRRLLASMLDEQGDSFGDSPLVADARAALAEPGPAPAEASTPLRSVVRQNRDLKRLAAGLYTALSQRHGSSGNPARRLMADVAIRQGQRELAFFRKTGWVGEQPELAAVLERAPG